MEVVVKGVWTKGNKRYMERWGKVVKAIDLSLTGGFALIGSWVNQLNDILTVCEEGSYIALFLFGGKTRHTRNGVVVLLRAKNGGRACIESGDLDINIENVEVVEFEKEVSKLIRNEYKQYKSDVLRSPVMACAVYLHSVLNKKEGGGNGSKE